MGFLGGSGRGLLMTVEEQRIIRRLQGLASGLSSRKVHPQPSETTSAEEWRPAPEDATLADGAPKQVLRAASPEFMQWLLSKLGSLGADTSTLTTREAVHGLGAQWSAKKQKASGFAYGAPTTPACIRALTASGRTSVYYYILQHPDAEPLRAELRELFGARWERACFGRATHFLSHSWGMPFAGFIRALSDVPKGSYR